jgi:hypothetical protein
MMSRTGEKWNEDGLGVFKFRWIGFQSVPNTHKRSYLHSLGASWFWRRPLFVLSGGTHAPSTRHPGRLMTAAFVEHLWKSYMRHLACVDWTTPLRVADRVAFLHQCRTTDSVHGRCADLA